jgi:DNA invertase Pin-like site-specific DNA recombinase
LDRLSRNAAFLLSLRDAGVRFVAADMPDMNEAVVGIMAVLAQAERNSISERTKAALAARKDRGLVLGTPRDLSAFQARASVLGNAAKAARADKHAHDIADMIEAAQASGAKSLRKIATYLNEHAATAPRGSKWTAASVQRALNRIQASSASLPGLILCSLVGSNPGRSTAS